MEVALSVLRFLGQEQGRTYKFTFIILFLFFLLMEEGITVVEEGVHELKGYKTKTRARVPKLSIPSRLILQYKGASTV